MINTRGGKLLFKTRIKSTKSLRYNGPVCVCVCVRARVCVCVCVRPFTVKVSSVWISWYYQGPDQQCCVEDFIFLCQVPSSLL